VTNVLIVGLFRGFVSTACREVPSFGIYFGSYTHMLKALTPPNTPPEHQPVMPILVAGGLAGALSWGVVYPVDVIKSNIQLSTLSAPLAADEIGATAVAAKGSSDSMVNVTRALYRRYGYGIFFRGFSTAVVRAVPVNAAVFFFYELFRGHLGI
jgi:solute carrier family 25 carnitine/acylcarnitine transporter 20/29